MKIYNEVPKDISKGIGRVRDALKLHAPDSVTFVGDRVEADLIVHHVIGVGNLDPEMPLHERIASDGKPYAILQYCLRTTENGGDYAYWGPLWAQAECVWSYYDLFAHSRPAMSADFSVEDQFEFYHAPLGVDPVFTKPLEGVPKLFTIGTSGYIAETEGVLEAAQAVKRQDGWQFHLGPDFGLGLKSVAQHNLTDAQVARRWHECDFVAGLRRVEGFELPAAEGLCCGARPILFDAPHYRQWFGDAGRYIPEGTFEDVVHAIDEILGMSAAAPVSRLEREWAARQFDWARLVPEFWKRVL